MFKHLKTITSHEFMHLKAVLTLLILSVMAMSNTVNAASKEELAEMQKQLNQKVMDAPFSPAQMAEVDAYIKDGMKRDLKPVKKAPSYWRPGYTCANVYGYGWRAYRDCRYYHRYYGRYWY